MPFVYRLPRRGKTDLVVSYLRLSWRARYAAAVIEFLKHASIMVSGNPTLGGFIVPEPVVKVRKPSDETTPNGAGRTVVRCSGASLFPSRSSEKVQQTIHFIDRWFSSRRGRNRPQALNLGMIELLITDRSKTRRIGMDVTLRYPSSNEGQNLKCTSSPRGNHVMAITGNLPK